jgi:hypothetical protein
VLVNEIPSIINVVLVSKNNENHEQDKGTYRSHVPSNPVVYLKGGRRRVPSEKYGGSPSRPHACKLHSILILNLIKTQRVFLRSSVTSPEHKN